MVKGSAEIGVRGSTWSSVFIVGAGAPDGGERHLARTNDEWGMTKSAASGAMCIFMTRN